jgi:hypothetical protein
LLVDDAAVDVEHDLSAATAFVRLLFVVFSSLCVVVAIDRSGCDDDMLSVVGMSRGYESV